MPNQININDVAGDLTKLNAQLKVTADYLAKLTADAEKLNAALGNSKGIKEFNENLAKSQKLATDTQKAQNQALLDNEKILKAKIQTEKAALDLAQKKAKATKDEGSAWEKLNNQYKAALKNARDLGAQYGKNSQQFKDATNAANKYREKIYGINKEFNDERSNVGRYFQAIMKGAGVLGLAVGASQLLSAGFDKLKTSSQAFGDAFDEAKGGVNAQITKFFSMIGTGDFTNFIDNLKKAGEAGRAYARELDNQFEGGLSLTIKEAESRLKVAELKVKQVQAKTKDEQDKIGLQILAELEKVTEARLTEAEKIYVNERDFMLKTHDINEAEFISFISNFRAESDMRDAALAKKQKAQQMEMNMYDRTILADGTVLKTINQNKQAEYEIFKNTFTNEEKLIIAFNDKYQGLANDNIQKTADSYAQFNNIKAQQLEESLRTEKKLATNANKEIIKEKANDIEQIESDPEIYLPVIKVNKEANAKKAKDNKEFADLINANNDEIVKNDIEGIEKRLKATEEAEKKKAQLIQDTLTQTGTFGNLLFDLGKSQRDQELADIESKYDKQITAAEGNAELQKSLANELERERKRIAREAAIAERNQALFNIAISTAEAVAKVWAQTGVAGVGAQLLPIAMGLLQASVVMARPLPGYFKGTENAPAGWGWLAEQGRELVSMPDGSSFIQEKPSLYNFKGGEKVKTHEATERIINEEINGKTDNSPKMVQNVSVNFNKQGLMVITEDSKNYTTYVNDKVRH